MKASIIVTIVLRLFAIQWVVTGVVGLLGVLGYSTTFPVGSEARVVYWFQMLVVPVCYIFLALAAWFFAALIAKCVVPNSDPELGMVSVSARDLYGLGILVVGITAFLSHLAPMLNWVHYLVLNRAGEALMQGRNGLSFYDVTKEAIPCIGGALLAIASPKIGARLARTEGTPEAEQAADGKTPEAPQSPH
jgi:hypothetical protein